MERRSHADRTEGGSMESKQLRMSLFTALCAFVSCVQGGFLIVNPAGAADVTVCPSGCDYTSIQAAINACGEGDTVFVGTPGRPDGAETYDENIALINGVSVVSEGDDATAAYDDPWSNHSTTAVERATLTIIRGSGSDSIVRIPGDATTDVTLDGFTIENSSVQDQFLIRVGGGSPGIKNNIIRNNTGSGHAGGIGLQGLGVEVSPVIENNLIHNVHGPGIGNGPKSYAIITDNEIWDCRGEQGPGIGLMGYACPSIENNIVFANARAGIGCYNAESGDGVTAEGGALTIPIIKGNTIYDNTEAGIRLSRSSGDTGTINATIGDSVTGNDIYGNKAGIRMDELTTATIENNDVHDNRIKSGLALFDVTSVTVDNNRIYDNEKAGINLEGIESVTINNVKIYGNVQQGIRFFAGVGTASVNNSEVYENAACGIRNVGAGTLTIESTDVYSNGYCGINIDWPGSENSVSDCNIYGNIKSGIIVKTANSATITDSHINANGLGGIRNQCGNYFHIQDNRIYDNGMGGVETRYGVGAITKNSIYQNNIGGIAIKAPCTYEITGNAIYDNLRGGIHTGGDSADGVGYIGTVGDAHLTIRKNTVYRNGQNGYGGGIDVRHADGVICNNLVYENHKGGIRFGDYIDKIANNTVVGNGENDTGAGIVYDDLAGNVNDPASGCALDDIPIINNICANNEATGINVKICPGDCPVNRDYNLLSANFGWDANPGCSGPLWESNPCRRQQLTGCEPNSNEMFQDPLFVDKANDNYRLQTDSPAKNAGDDGTDMGAYGGSDPINP